MSKEINGLNGIDTAKTQEEKMKIIDSVDVGEMLARLETERVENAEAKALNLETSKETFEKFEKFRAERDVTNPNRMEEIEEPQEPTPDITACIIYAEKDAKFLNDCIESIKRLNIPIVLCKTIPVPMKNMPNRWHLVTERDGIKHVEYLYQFEGKNPLDFTMNEFSFSNARNACKSFADTTWILSIDADERLCMEKSELESILNLPERYKTVTVDIKNYVRHNEKPVLGFEAGVHTVCRIFRRELDWFGRCHEQIMPNDVGVESVINSSVLIKHIGYQSPTSKEVKYKYLRNIGMMCGDLALCDFSKLTRAEHYYLKNMRESIAHLFKFPDFMPKSIEIMNLEVMKENKKYMSDFGVNLNFDLTGIAQLIQNTCAGLCQQPYNNVLLVDAFKSINLFLQLTTEL